jgi:DNA polymerase III delta prime subunit
MDQLDLDTILEREDIIQKIVTFLKEFDENKKNLLTLRGLYLYGSSGIGKTQLIKNILKNNDYDMIYYDASDIRNKSIIENITYNTMSDVNVLSMFQKKTKKIVIVMDEIGGMNTGDKGGINQLIKLIRQKKTKNQKKEKYTLNPIICISNVQVDKKILELRKVCKEVEVKEPSDSQISKIIKNIIPNLSHNECEKLTSYVNHDLRKVNFVYNLYKNDNIEFLYNHHEIFKGKYFENDTKHLVKKLISNKYSIEEHNEVISETDRTSIALLFHENIIDTFTNTNTKTEILDYYMKFLDNICFADYIDRITFQKQIWCFNEITSLIKTFYNNKLLHESIKNIHVPQDIRFTKVLTKYSTEYNNSLFLQGLCQKLQMGLSDLKQFFIYLKFNYEIEEIYTMLEMYDITNLEINRAFRFYKFLE